MFPAAYERCPLGPFWMPAQPCPHSQSVSPCECIPVRTPRQDSHMRQGLQSHCKILSQQRLQLHLPASSRPHRARPRRGALQRMQAGDVLDAGCLPTPPSPHAAAPPPTDAIAFNPHHHKLYLAFSPVSQSPATLPQTPPPPARATLTTAVPPTAAAIAIRRWVRPPAHAISCPQQSQCST